MELWRSFARVMIWVQGKKKTVDRAAVSVETYCCPMQYTLLGVCMLLTCVVMSGE